MEQEALTGALAGAADVLMVGPAQFLYNWAAGLAYRATGNERFRAQAEAFTETAQAVEHSIQSPQRLVTAIGEGVVESKREYDARIEAGDAFGASRAWGRMGTQAFLAVEGASSVKLTPTPRPALATAEGQIIEVGATVARSSSEVPTGVLLSKKAKGGGGSTRGGTGPIEKGKAGVEKSKAEAAEAGETLVGEEITFELPSGRRTRSDLVLVNEEGLKVRESKQGPRAKLTEPQKQMQDAARRGEPVVPRGKKAREAGLPPGEELRVGEFKEDRHKDP
jgi:hypothetical protein